MGVGLFWILKARKLNNHFVANVNENFNYADIKNMVFRDWKLINYGEIFCLFYNLITICVVGFTPNYHLMKSFFSNEFFHVHVPHQRYTKFLSSESCNVHIGISFILLSPLVCFFRILVLSMSLVILVLQKLNRIF